MLPPRACCNIPGPPEATPRHSVDSLSQRFKLMDLKLPMHNHK